MPPIINTVRLPVATTRFRGLFWWIEFQQRGLPHEHLIVVNTAGVASDFQRFQLQAAAFAAHWRRVHQVSARALS